MVKFTKFLEEVKADYSWYAKDVNPVMFMARLLLRPYFRFLFVFRVLSNFYCGGGKNRFVTFVNVLSMDGMAL